MFAETDQMRQTQNGFGNKWKPGDDNKGGLQPDDDSDEEGLEEEDDDENLDQDDEDEESDHNFWNTDISEFSF